MTDAEFRALLGEAEADHRRDGSPVNYNRLLLMNIAAELPPRLRTAVVRLVRGSMTEEKLEAAVVLAREVVTLRYEKTARYANDSTI